MRERNSKDWENWLSYAGPDGILLLGFKNPDLKPLTGMTIAEVARKWGQSPEDTIVDLVIKDKSRVDAAYFLIDEANVSRVMSRPWVSFGADYAARAPEGVFKLASAHPRVYGNFARVFAKYVREDHVLSVEEAVRRMTSLPADNLSLPDRGRLRPGAFADVVVFNPTTIQDHATYQEPHQLSTGVSHVVVNGTLALTDGKLTRAAPGRVVRGRAWTGAGGGCRSSSSDWTWSNY
jgi:N-acyl-D-amino-acid deacylase